MEVRTSSLPGPGRSIAALLGFFVLCFGVAAVGAAAASHSIPTWYAGLNKPSFNPPNWIFGPVWTVLYALMAIAAWLVWKTPRREGERGSFQSIQDTRGAARLDALAVFFLQLGLNFLWTPIFFYYHRMLVSLVVILALWLAIVATMVLFWRVRTLAGALLVPYLAWVSFATALNLVLLRLN